MFSKSVTKNVCPPPNYKNTWPSYIAEYLLSLPRGVKRTVMLSADFAMSCICLFLALSLRYGNIAHHISPAILIFYAAIPISGLYTIGFYKGVARSFLDNVMGSVAQLFFILLIIFEVIIYLNPLESIPRSVPVIFLFLYFIWLWNSRLITRELLMRRWGQHRSHLRNEGSCDNIVIYGAGEAGRNLLKGLRNSHNYNVVAYVDDDRQLIGGYLLGKRFMLLMSLSLL